MTRPCILQRGRAVLVELENVHWQSNIIGLLYYNGQQEDVLVNIQESILDHGGQFLAFSIAEPLTETFPEMFNAVLQNACGDRSMQISLPVILQHNPHIASPFLNRAILWQQICELIIADDDPCRKTVIVLENVDQASPVVQRDLARLIRFHTVNFIHRTFIFTLDRHSREQIIPELQEILGIQKRAA